MQYDRDPLYWGIANGGCFGQGGLKLEPSSLCCVFGQDTLLSHSGEFKVGGNPGQASYSGGSTNTISRFMYTETGITSAVSVRANWLVYRLYFLIHSNLRLRPLLLSDNFSKILNVSKSDH